MLSTSLLEAMSPHKSSTQVQPMPLPPRPPILCGSPMWCDSTVHIHKRVEQLNLAGGCLQHSVHVNEYKSLIQYGLGEHQQLTPFSLGIQVSVWSGICLFGRRRVGMSAGGKRNSISWESTCPANCTLLPLSPHLTLWMYLCHTRMYVFHMCMRFFYYLQVRIFLLNVFHKPREMQDWVVDREDSRESVSQ